MSWKSLVNRAVKIGIDEGMKFLRESQSSKSDRRDSGPRDTGRRDTGGDVRPNASPTSARPGAGRGGSAADGDSAGGSRSGGGYPGDFRGSFRPQYAPDLDGSADPGEIVWGWVPFEEDHSQGKDRPALVVGSDGPWSLVLMLSSKDHIPGGVGEVREDSHARWMNIGTGDWDREGRPSEIRLDRIIRMDPDSIRREGAIVSREVFDLIAAQISAD